MEDDPRDRIRHHAYLLWQAAGCPSGRDEEFWHKAVAAEEGLLQPAETDAPPDEDPARFAGF